MSNLSYKNKKGFNPYPLIAIAFIGFMLLYQFKLKDKWYGKSDDNENCTIMVNLKNKLILIPILSLFNEFRIDKVPI